MAKDKRVKSTSNKTVDGLTESDVMKIEAKKKKVKKKTDMYGNKIFDTGTSSYFEK